MSKSKESPEASRAYAEYAGLGEHRTLELLANIMLQRRIEEHRLDATKHIPKKATILTYLKRCSAQHRWQERIKEYDAKIIAEQAKAKRKKLEEALEKMNDYHADLAKGLLIKTAKRLQELLDSDDPKEKLWGRDAVALFKETVAIEKLSRGAATERIENDTTISGNPDAPLVVKTQWGTSPLEDDKDNEP